MNSLTYILKDFNRKAEYQFENILFWKDHNVHKIPAGEGGETNISTPQKLTELLLLHRRAICSVRKLDT